MFYMNASPLSYLYPNEYKQPANYSCGVYSVLILGLGM